MTWLKVDDGFNEHPKIAQAGKLAQALFIDGLCYSSRQLTDGFIRCQIPSRFGYGRALNAAVTALVDVGLWEEAEGGYRIHDYLKYQQPAAKVRAERETAKARMLGRRSANVRPNISRTSANVRQMFGESSANVRQQDRDIEGDKERDENPPDSPPTGQDGADALSAADHRPSKTFSWPDWGSIPHEVQAELLAYGASKGLSEANVREYVDDALNNKARHKRIDTVRYLQNWLRDNAPGGRYYHDPAPGNSRNGRGETELKDKIGAYR